MHVRLSTPEEIASRGSSEIPFLRLPERASVFADRAARLRTLAAGHAMQGYLEFIAIVADEQHKLLGRMPPVALPPATTIALCNEHGMPPLNVLTLSRDPQWCNGLRHLLHEIAARTSGAQAEAVRRLEACSYDVYERQASALLVGDAFEIDAAAAPFIGAALQVYFTHLVIALGETAFPRTDVATLCPCCGSRPVASIARVGANETGYRFLHCALCSAEWHMVRVKCSACGSTKGISYFNIEAASEAVKAECCDECKTYLKIFYLEKDTSLVPAADDLASLALDMLVDREGYNRIGPNPLFLPGPL